MAMRDLFTIGNVAALLLIWIINDDLFINGIATGLIAGIVLVILSRWMEST